MIGTHNFWSSKILDLLQVHLPTQTLYTPAGAMCISGCVCVFQIHNLLSQAPQPHTRAHASDWLRDSPIAYIVKPLQLTHVMYQGPACWRVGVCVAAAIVTEEGVKISGSSAACLLLRSADWRGWFSPSCTRRARTLSQPRVGERAGRAGWRGVVTDRHSCASAIKFYCRTKVTSHSRKNAK